MKYVSLTDLAIAAIPVGVLLAVLIRWNVQPQRSAYALVRMLLQLSAIGYVLAYIFEAPSALVVLLVVSFMASVASWIALAPVRRNVSVTTHLGYNLMAILGAGVLVLALITQLVLEVDPWYDPAVVIPLAGMIFGQGMNSVSLAAERYQTERQRVDPAEARSTAMRAALIPITNSLFAVGLVSLPGLMTGQILSGVNPLLAARYQIMVMLMVYSAAGLASAVYLALVYRDDSSFLDAEGENHG